MQCEQHEQNMKEWAHLGNISQIKGSFYETYELLIKVDRWNLAVSLIFSILCSFSASKFHVFWMGVVLFLDY